MRAHAVLYKSNLTVHIVDLHKISVIETRTSTTACPGYGAAADERQYCNGTGDLSSDLHRDGQTGI